MQTGSKCTKNGEETLISACVAIPANMEVCLCKNDQLQPHGPVHYLQYVISVYKL